MCPPVTPWMMWAGCLCLFAAVVSGGSGEKKVYGKLGGEVDLRPEGPSISSTNSKIMWKIGSDIAIDKDGEISPRFENRVHLNTTNGVMSITGLMYKDSGVYTPTIENNNINEEGNPINLIIISAVPKPTIIRSCDQMMTRCTLTCTGNTTGAEPVRYTWKAEDAVMSETSATIDISEEHSSNVKNFTCEMSNSVSQESSQCLNNPLFRDTTPEPEGELKIALGVTVFVVLIMPVILLVIFHRWKTGMWFYQKDSMPWEAEFWRSQNGQQQGAAVSNGTPAHQQRTEEETPMT